ncbi:NAD(P)H-dependent oxidoreductase [Streptomyces lunalinharesii]|uniref:NAD(P)H-dependent oxidoreductase n=1 Tax=Streptomyces lunalinharesii TaxID=333384 RepID=A0ABP6E2M3_9ACTN
MSTDNSPRRPRILAVSGSLRAGSHNTQALRAVAALLVEDATVTVWDGLAAVPPFSEDDEHLIAGAVESLRAALRDADHVLIATPEYNASIPGQLKNALDWASRPFGDAALTGKAVTVISASPSTYGAQWAQDHLRTVLSTAGAHVTDFSLAIPQAHTAFTDDDAAHRAELRGRLTALADHLRRQARPECGQPARDQGAPRRRLNR